MTEPISLDIDLDSLTLGDMETVKEQTGLEVYELGEELASGHLSAKALLVLVWLAKRKENPEFTFEQARAFKISDVKFAGRTTPPPLEEPAPAAGG